MKIRYLLPTLGLLVACGGDDAELSGVSGSTLVSEMTSDEIRQFCQYAVNTMGGEGRVVDCGDGKTVNVGTTESCVSNWRYSGPCPSFFVKDFEACLVARGEGVCRELDEIAACQPLLACAQTGEAEDDQPGSPPIAMDEWSSCYLSGMTQRDYACLLEWRCPDGADRAVECDTIGGYYDYQCTCRNVKEGVDEGRFTSSDFCQLASHNAAYRANQACGYYLPEI